jgi:hypothetical protein
MKCFIENIALHSTVTARRREIVKCADWIRVMFKIKGDNSIQKCIIFTYKLRQKSVSEISQHLFAQFSKIIVTKFCEINFYFVLISYLAKFKKIDIRIHPCSEQYWLLHRLPSGKHKAR